MRWTANAARVEEMRWDMDTKFKRLLCRPRSRWEDS